MPQASAAISRRFIAGVVRTAPNAFNRRRNDARPPGAFPTFFAATRSATCLIRVVFVVRFEMADGIMEGLVEIEIRQPALFPQVSASCQHVLMRKAMRRIETGKNTIPRRWSKSST